MLKNITESPIKIWAAVLLLLAIPVTSCRKSPPADTKKPDTGPGEVTEIKTDDIKTNESAEPEIPADTESKVALPIELPRPMFVGTPQNIQGVSN